MKRLPHNNWATWLECGDRQRAAGRYNPASEISFKIPAAHCHKTVTIGAGRSDGLEVFYEGQRIYVLATNSALEYVGLEVFEDTGCEDGTADKVTSIFMDSSDEQLGYVLGLSAVWRAKRLANWIDA